MPDGDQTLSPMDLHEVIRRCPVGVVRLLSVLARKGRGNAESSPQGGQL